MSGRPAAWRVPEGELVFEPMTVAEFQAHWADVAWRKRMARRARRERRKVPRRTILADEVECALLAVLAQWGPLPPRDAPQAAKSMAHALVQEAMGRGELEAAWRCEDCGTDEVEPLAHHDDYSRPLSVRWLCAQCHAKWHQRERTL